ncbi:MAG: hypothetical protein M3R17_07005 [Bacteroidota bacterium]|nr:hypothetical protein [Bacteroidota bacterium]
MKKFVFSSLVAAFAFTASYAAEVNTSANVKSDIVIGSPDWMKSAEGTWTGMSNNKKVWYKLNAKDATIWWSTDGKKWEQVKDGMWQDKSGKWLKISENKLVWSADGGKTWSEVPDWSWEDADGNWHKFDKDWTLWTKKGM